MGIFVMSERKNGDHQFVLKAENGQVILVSQGYSSRDGCLNGIESVKRNAQHEEMFERLDSSDGRFYFNLKATNGQVIGNSQMYQGLSGVTAGIHSVMANAPGARIMEEKIREIPS